MSDKVRPTDPLNVTTISGAGTTMRGAVAGLSQRVPALTLLYHPELGRIGERARLSALTGGESASLSRLEPDFATKGSRDHQPLADGRISRQPIALQADAEGGICVRVAPGGSTLAVDGVPVSAQVIVSATALERGVVLEVADRVLLLLHTLSPPRAPGPDFGILGESEAIAALRAGVLNVADVAVPLLIRGESGSGKERVASAIHQAGPRRGAPFVSVNTAAISHGNAASQLNVQIRGAFSGAHQDHPGYFGAADGGTLFLDEIGEIPDEVQPMLLRALDSGEIQPVGARAPKRVDVRLVAATDADLEAAVEAGSFRAALYHRLAGYQIGVPSLRERRDDIARLFMIFVRQEMKALGAGDLLNAPPGKPWLPRALMRALLSYHWPGNVRQLKNATRQLVISSRGEPRARLDATLEKMLAEPTPPEYAAATVALETGPIADRRRPSEIDEADLLDALKACAYQPGPAAKRLGISRTSLYQLMAESDRVVRAADLDQEAIEATARAHAGDLAAMADALKISKRALQLRMKQLGMHQEPVR